MPVAHDHAAIQSVVPRLSGRNDLDLSGEKILLLDIILLLQKF